MRRLVRWGLAAVIVLHGAIHLLGTAEGLGWADVDQLTEPVSRGLGVAWGVAAVVVVAAAVLLVLRVRGRWWAMLAAALVSQVLVLTSWSDASAGTAANVLMVLAAAFGLVRERRGGLRAEYRSRVATALGDPVLHPLHHRTDLVTEADLEGLPDPVASYLRVTGSVGRPRVIGFRARIHGRLRGGPDQPWMPFTGEQVSLYGHSPRRLFLLDATMRGLPVDVLHVFDDYAATMRAKALSVFSVLDSAGEDMTRAETVTLLNDLCLLAPAALVDAPVTWEWLDHDRVHATYTVGRHTVTAELAFNRVGELVDFRSEDRLLASSDGGSFTPVPWRTPVGPFREYGARRLAVGGEAWWEAPEGAWCYGELALDAISYLPEVAEASTSRPGVSLRRG